MAEGEDGRRTPSTPPVPTSFPLLDNEAPLDLSSAAFASSSASAGSGPTASFDVDAFLVSHASSGTSLASLTARLSQHAVQLQTRLEDVVESDFRGFVNLGSALKAEGPRIARLDWKVARAPAAPAEDDETGATRKASVGEGAIEPHDRVGSNLGLDLVREDVVHARDRLRAAEAEVTEVMKRREAVRDKRASLELLVGLGESLARLENLLDMEQRDAPRQRRAERRRSRARSRGDEADEEAKKEESHGQREQGSDEEISEPQQSARYWQSFQAINDELNGGLAVVSDDEDSEADEQDSDEGYAAGSTVNGKVRRPSLARNLSSNDAKPHRRRSSALLSGSRGAAAIGRDLHSYGSTTISGDGSQSYENGISDLSQQASSTTLPTRIARASSEYNALMFLRQRAVEQHLVGFVEAHELRLQRAKDCLKEYLAKLVSLLTEFQGSSLLVPPAHEENSEDTNALLRSWSHAQNKEERKKEQESWLELALSTWSKLGAAREAEEAIRASLFDPWANETIHAGVLSDASANGVVGNGIGAEDGARFQDAMARLEDFDGQTQRRASSLINLYRRILAFVAGTGSTVSQVAEKVLLGSPHPVPSTASTSQMLEKEDRPCDIYVNVVCDSICTRLMDELGGQLFFVGRPEVFHRNFKATSLFLASLERLAPSKRAAAAFRSSPVNLALQKRWQLPVYFQMRLRDVVSRLESRLAASSGPNNFGVPTAIGDDEIEAASHDPPRMIATAATLTAFVAPWREESHIHELVPRQWRLSLQVLSRYKAWLYDEELPSDLMAQHSAALMSLNKSSSRGHSRTGSAGGYSTPPPSTVISSPVRSGTPTVGVDVESQTAHDDAALKTLTIVAADAAWLQNRVESAFEKVIVPKITAVDGEGCQDRDERASAVIEHLGKTLDGSFQLRRALVPLLGSRVQAILKTRCAEPLRLVRSVSTQYRGGNAPSSSTEPSYFVGQFLRPLRMYLGRAERNTHQHQHNQQQQQRPAKTAAQELNTETRSLWAQIVVEDFLERYTQSLYTMNKNFESLRRLKRPGAGGGGGGGGGIMSGLFGGGTKGAGQSNNDAEAERMYRQMSTDVDWLASDVEEWALPLEQGGVDTRIDTSSVSWQRLKEAAKGATGD
ncbi:COG2-domain-containing protein [Acaromyces ingoldii]|uniref:Conserved oligomeric Golgi complex subunit 2 n=1 Tax=Acaromyces ingoldii TaxID=215250 RepID=A0A316YG04_9BASI|nr:COG2-domain-containing protein [Acaromyces ingoldii]PWN87558.1 COG2-domain-containing protein [Acaromyces ingoldii]